jgi:hypothetical protein
MRVDVFRAIPRYRAGVVEFRRLLGSASESHAGDDDVNKDPDSTESDTAQLKSMLLGIPTPDPASITRYGSSFNGRISISFVCPGRSCVICMASGVCCG